MTASIRVRKAADGDAPALAAFFREVWSADATAESVEASRKEAARLNLAEPGTDVPTVVAVSGDRVIGYVSSIPMQVWAGGHPCPAYWVKGLMVLPEYRSGPIGFLVMKELIKSLPRSGILTVAPAARRLFEALGYRDVGVVPNRLRILRGGRVTAQLDPTLIPQLPKVAARGLMLLQRLGLARPAGALGGAAMSAYAWASARAARGYRLERGPVAPTAIDELWTRTRAGLAAASVRDGNTMQYRYGLAEEGGVYGAATAWRGNTLAGLAVVRRPRDSGDPRLRGIRVSTISDLLFPLDERSAGLAALRSAERAARAFGADALLMSSTDAVVARLLGRQGYAGLGGNLHFLWRDVSAPRADVPEQLGRWWITRGDGESDAVF